MNHDNTTAASAATHTHETIGRKEFRTYMADVFGRRGERGKVFRASYHLVEYFNAPSGLVVFAHRDAIEDWQVDGIHPDGSDQSIDASRNIIEPLRSRQAGEVRYNVHCLTRRSQGILLHDAFADDRPAYDIEADHTFSIPIESTAYFTLEIFDTPQGPIVGVFEGKDRVHTIRPIAEPRHLGRNMAA